MEGPRGVRASFDLRAEAGQCAVWQPHAEFFRANRRSPWLPRLTAAAVGDTIAADTPARATARGGIRREGIPLRVAHLSRWSDPRGERAPRGTPHPFPDSPSCRGPMKQLILVIPEDVYRQLDMAARKAGPTIETGATTNLRPGLPLPSAAPIPLVPFRRPRFPEDIRNDCHNIRLVKSTGTREAVQSSRRRERK
jgi:hypothetical protein